jgi:VanZ family protein
MKTLKAYPLTSLCVVVIWIICLIPIPETPLSDVPFIDKWTHIVMYVGLTSLFWIEYWRYARRHHPFPRLKLWMVSFVAPILMSGLIELAQAYCTGGNRSGDWMDFLANSLGAVIGLLLGWTLWRAVVKRWLK